MGTGRVTESRAPAGRQTSPVPMQAGRALKLLMTTRSINHMDLWRSKSPARYRFVTEEKAGGATFTPVRLADFVARQIVGRLRRAKHRVARVLDPAVGEGALLLSLLRELGEARAREIEVYGFDTNPGSLSVAEKAIRGTFPLARVHLQATDFLEYAGRPSRPLPLFCGADPRSGFDAVIANPPYVRTQIMGAAHAQSLAAHFGLAGRVDLYHAFILGMIEVLNPDGVAGFIVSNRFMTTRSGAAVRRALREGVRVEHVWDLGDTKLFDAAVLPAIVLLTKGEARGRANPAFTSVYRTEEPASCSARDPIEALARSGVVSVEDGRRFQVTHGSLHLTGDVDDVWRVATDGSETWLKTVAENTWRSFGDIGSIRVGIKTCADDVFIRSDWDAVAERGVPELLHPLTTHHVGRRFKADSPKLRRRILYPHVVNDRGLREPADLSRYPASAAYLEKHRPRLEARPYLMQAGRRWYEIWVPQDPGAWERAKLVFRDICDAPTFWMDLDGTVVNGDCYWLSPRAGIDTDRLWLALAVANSSFAEAFYDRRFHNKLYAGRRRFMTQYVESFPLPDPSRAESRAMVDLAKEIYRLTPSPAAKSLEMRLDDLVWRAFGVAQSKKSAGNGI